MARSPRSSLTGVNLQKIDGQRCSDLNLATYLLYDESAAFAPELRSRVPDTRIVLRLIANYRWDEPETTAYAGADLVHRYPQVDFVCPANEQNYEDNADSHQIAAWCDRFSAAWERQGWPRPIITPAVSPGRPYDLNALHSSWQAWDAIGVHGYTTLEALDFGPAKGIVQQHAAVWPGKPLWLTEFNVEKLEAETYRHAEGAAAVEQFLNWLVAQGYVAASHWFLDDSNDWPYRLTRIPPLLDLYKRIGHETGGNPHPEPPQPSPGPDPGLVAKYNLSGFIHESPEMGISLEDVTNGQVAWDVYGPADLLVVTYTTGDGGNRQQGYGHAGQTFAAESKYFPENGQHGPWTAECGGARIDGIGMKPDHQHPNVRFTRRSAPPQPPSGHVWGGDFARFAAEHPEVGQPIGPLAYLPQDTEPWPCCAQVSATHCLVWNGWSTFAIHR